MLVSDNASTDETSIISRDFKRRFTGNFSYFKKKENFCDSNNFVKSIQRSEGKYVWLLGDDNIPNKNCLQNLLEVLDTNTDLLHPSNNEYDMIYNGHTNLKKDSDYVNDASNKQS